MDLLDQRLLEAYYTRKRIYIARTTLLENDDGRKHSVTLTLTCNISTYT
jgi:hypothetical protein